jgi:competence protein ComEA
MPTANERRALWFLAIVALSGSVVRLVRARAVSGADPTPDAQLEHQLIRIDSAREKQAFAKKSPPAPGKRFGGSQHPERRAPQPKPVDLDQATAREIEALPGIGPSLAERIVAYRDSIGGLGSMEVLCRVRGVGPAMIADLRKRVVFSGSSKENGACEVTPPAPSKSHVTNRGKPR